MQKECRAYYCTGGDDAGENHVLCMRPEKEKHTGKKRLQLEMQPV